ncbi:hypothetical protein D3C80_1111840 [compost metagenome]
MDFLTLTRHVSVNQQALFQVVRNDGGNIFAIDFTQFGLRSIHPQPFIGKIEIDGQIGQCRPVRLELEGRMAQRDKYLKLAFMFTVREVLRVTVVEQRGVIHLPALNGTAEVVHQVLAHQGFREVTPGVCGIIQADTGQNAQPRIPFGRLLVAEITVHPQRFGFHIQIFTRQLPALWVVQPG